MSAPQVPATPSELTPPAPPVDQQLVPATPPNPAEPTPPPGTPPATPPATDAAKLQAELAQERQARERAEKQARDHQAAYTQTRQALSALMGQQGLPPQQQADPLEPFVNKLVAKGYNAEDARAIVSVSHEMTAAYTQQLAMQNRSLQAQMTVEEPLNQAFSAAPTIFADHEIANEVRNRARQWAAETGQPVDPAFVLNVGKQLYMDKYVLKANGNGHTPQPSAPQPVQFSGMYGNPQQSFAPRPPANQPDPFEAQRAAELERVKKEYNL